MDPDDYQQAWQTHSSQTRVTVDADLLLKEVQRNQLDFRATILRRDVIEVGVGLLLLPYWFYAGITHSLPWTWYLTVPALIWIIGFFLVDRMRHPQRPSEPGAPLLQSVQESLAQVEHQIWMLRNIFWWYLLPPSISISAFFVHVTWLSFEEWLDALGFTTFLFVFLFALYYLIYELNQRAVRLQLEPRRRELLTLLASLGDESMDAHTSMNSAGGVEKTGKLKGLLIFACLCFVVFKLVDLAGVFDGDRSEGGGHPRLSPFAAVRWHEFQPKVKVGRQWYTLVALDDLPAAEIVAFSRQTYGDKWRKRFEEDLVEVLTRMEHPPKDKVTLVVQSLTSSETQVLKDVSMTAANREAIRAAAQSRKNSEP
jgi:hypothetical protein